LFKSNKQMSKDTKQGFNTNNDSVYAGGNAAENSASVVDPLGAWMCIPKQGTSTNDTLCEFTDNAIDARHTERTLTIKHYITDDDKFIISDNGIGMSQDTLNKKFLMLYQSTDDSGLTRTGTSGFGVKAGIHKFAGKNKFHIITKHTDYEYIQVHTSWEEMMDNIKQGKPIITPVILKRGDKHIELFDDYNPEGTGTMYIFETNDDINSMLNVQYNHTHRLKKGAKLNDSLVSVYANIPNIEFDYKYKTFPIVRLKLDDFYKPHDQDTSNYLYGTDGRRDTTIYVKYNESTSKMVIYYKNKNNKYSYRDSIMTKWKTVDTKDDVIIGSVMEPRQCINDFEFRYRLSCLKPNTKIWDGTKIPTSNGLSVTDKYRTRHFGTGNTTVENNNKVVIVRQNTIIGNVSNGKEMSVGGGNATKYRQVFMAMNIAAELQFKSTGSQDDPTDAFMGMRNNKHQYEKEEFKNVLFWDALNDIRTKFGENLYELMEGTVNEYKEKKAAEKLLAKQAAAVEAESQAPAPAEATAVEAESQAPAPAEATAPTDDSESQVAETDREAYVQDYTHPLQDAFGKRFYLDLTQEQRSVIYKKINEKDKTIAALEKENKELKIRNNASM
jgi:hypothetical protein